MLYYGIRNFKKTVNAFNNRKKMYRTEYLYFLKGGNKVSPYLSITRIIHDCIIYTIIDHWCIVKMEKKKY